MLKFMLQIYIQAFQLLKKKKKGTESKTNMFGVQFNYQFLNNQYDKNL